MRRWQKLGLVWAPTGEDSWARSHAMLPTPVALSDEVIRVFVTCWDSQGIGRCAYVDVRASDPTDVIAQSAEPVLDIGRPGMFDAHGVAGCSVVRTADGRLSMYYVGFEQCVGVRYRLFTGLGTSDDDGVHFSRVSETPILDRSPAESQFRCGPHVVADGGVFRMWYVAGSAWTTVDGKSMPLYDLHYLESSDGLHWGRRGRPVMTFADDDEYGLGRPWVTMHADGSFSMEYCVRRRSDSGYRLGHATSGDGLRWTRRDDDAMSPGPAAYDDQAIMYAAIVSCAGREYCFYNGNDYGRHGFAVAVRQP